MSVARLALGRLRLVRNGFRPRRGGTPGRALRHPAVALAIVGAMAAVAWAGFRALLHALIAAGATPAECAAALGVALDAAFVGLLVFDLDAAVATLLLDPDLDLLRRAPLRPGAVLAIKLADAVPRTATPLAALALPALLAWAGAFPPAAWGALAPAIVLAALWTSALGLGIAAVLPALVVVPARRAREALGLVATFSITGIWLVNALWVPRIADEGGEPVARLLGAVTVAARALPWSPGQVSARLLAAAGADDPAAAAREAGALALAVAAALAVAWRSAGAFLPRVLDAVAAPRVHARVPRPRVDARRDLPRPLLGAVMARDARLFTRDWTVLADVLTAAALWTLLPLVSRAVLETQGGALVRAMLATLAVGLGYEIAARTVPFERRAVTWVRLAPVDPGRWLAAKLAGAAALALPLIAGAWVLLGAVTGLRPAEWAETGAFALGALGLSLGLGLWAGTRFGDPKWTNPRAMLHLGGRLVAAGLMMAQIALWLLLGTFSAMAPAALPGGRLALLALAIGAGAGGALFLATRAAVGRLEWHG